MIFCVTAHIRLDERSGWGVVWPGELGLVVCLGSVAVVALVTRVVSGPVW